ncbi:MAG TPA: GDSL-type esterase/lipase family protein, partial [Acidimicrobiia bacterium]|nr:GDSL-type esterase/lipase family protein [Acidimicrobiia bacterium]
LGTIAGATGVVQPQFDSRVGAGLSNRTGFDWPQHAAQEMARLNPEIAVFIIGANDFAVPMNTALDDTGEPAWKAQYTALIEEMLVALGSDTRTVIWVASPPFADDRNAQIKQLDDLMRDVMARHQNAAFVDTYTLFSDADGKYQGSLPPLDDPNGQAVVVRAGDGVHFTPQGADRLAKTVFPLIDAQCKVTKQAVPGVVKGTIQTEGSTQVVGGTNRGGTVQTSPPATSPPQPQVTSPPATSPPPVETTPTTVPAPTTTPTTAAPSSPG